MFKQDRNNTDIDQILPSDVWLLDIAYRTCCTKWI